MKSQDQWFDEYAVSHQNSKNIVIHKICVPLITVSLLMVLWAIPVPSFFAPPVNWSTLFVAAAVIFYLSLSWRYALFMALVIGVVLYGIALVAAHDSSMLVSVGIPVFVLAWVGQFVGHRIEGRKPSFLTDLQFLLIGPLWVVAKFARLRYVLFLFSSLFLGECGLFAPTIVG